MDYFPVIFSLLFVAFQGAPETAVLGAELSPRAEKEVQSPLPAHPGDPAGPSVAPAPP